MEEQWKPIPDFPDYEVSDQGWVRSYKSTSGKRLQYPHIMKPSKAHRYLVLSLSKDGKRTYCYVHHLVAQAFLGPCPNGMECCHINDDSMNNQVGNLYYATSHQNHLDALQNGCIAHQQKLNPVQVRQIRQMTKEGHTCRELAKQFNVSRQLISNIARKIAYPHID